MVMVGCPKLYLSYPWALRSYVPEKKHELVYSALEHSKQTNPNSADKNGILKEEEVLILGYLQSSERV